MEAVLNYGYNIIEVMQELKNNTKKEIEKQTAMNVMKVELVARGIHIEEE